MMTPERKISKARTELILSQPWFGTLALKLRYEVNNSIPTMATDGTRIFYNESFVSQITDEELMGVIAHEVMHCANLHPFRRESRDMLKWNMACDFVINHQLTECAFKLPKGILLDKQYAGLSSEQVYPRMKDQTQQQKQKGQGGQGQGQGKPQSGAGAGWNIGDCIDAPAEKPKPGKPDKTDKSDGEKGQNQGKGQGKGKSQGQDSSQDASQDANSGDSGTAGDDGDSSGDMTAADWEIAVTQAERVASAAGKMPAGISRTLANNRKGKVDWKSALRRFLQNTRPSDYNWGTPNRRFLSRGLILPGIKKENIGAIGVVVDTSGSIDGPMLEEFAAEITAIMHETRPEKITVIYCDAKVHGDCQEFLPDNGDVELEPRGGGGTAFQPAFDWFAEQPESPIAVVYLTDLESSDRPEDPGYPVLWVTPDWISHEPVFGDVLRIPDCTR